jgi:hypothetical protein
MVGYDTNNDALTLGDDDSLKVGDYELKYSSANDRFEVEHPNGEVSDVPRSTSGSLVPEGFADVLSNGEVLADNGEIYASVQDAVNAASGFVFVGPGTFNENVTISTDGLTLEGSGHDSLIDGGTTGNGIVANASNITVSNLTAQTTAGAGNLFDAFLSADNETNIKFFNCVARDSDQEGFNIQTARDVKLINCTVISADDDGIDLRSGKAARGIVSNCDIQNGVGSKGINVGGDDTIISNCTVSGVVNEGIFIGANDCTVIGCRVDNTGLSGIQANGIDNIIANCRISDSGGAADLNDTGTGTVLDGNLTGPSN